MLSIAGLIERPARTTREVNDALHINCVDRVHVDLAGLTLKRISAGGSPLTGPANCAVLIDCDFRGGCLRLTGHFTIVRSNIAFCEFDRNRVTVIDCEELSFLQIHERKNQPPPLNASPIQLRRLHK